MNSDEHGPLFSLRCDIALFLLSFLFPPRHPGMMKSSFCFPSSVANLIGLHSFIPSRFSPLDHNHGPPFSFPRCRLRIIEAPFPLFVPRAFFLSDRDHRGDVVPVAPPFFFLDPVSKNAGGHIPPFPPPFFEGDGIIAGFFPS